MELKKWQEPEINDLSVENTQEPATLDEPHAYHCLNCNSKIMGYKPNPNGKTLCELCDSDNVIWIGDGGHPTFS